jgi:hypothetical protein
MQWRKLLPDKKATANVIANGLRESYKTGGCTVMAVGTSEMRIYDKG